MLAARITCPRCGQVLTVTENAPSQVTCPRCLARLVNPASPLSGVRPVPVISLDRQVERDTGIGTWLIGGLGVILVCAAIATFGSGDRQGGAFLLMLIAGIATVLFLIGGLRGAKKPAVEDPETPPRVGADLVVPEGPAVLEYRRPVPPGRAAATAGAVVAGFFSAIAVCGLGFFTLGSTVDLSASRRPGVHAIILAAVVLLVIAFIVAAVRVSGRWRGFGPGAIAGMCLGMMALGPCAACYLMTLG